MPWDNRVTWDGKPHNPPAVLNRVRNLLKNTMAAQASNMFMLFCICVATMEVPGETQDQKNARQEMHHKLMHQLFIGNSCKLDGTRARNKMLENITPTISEAISATNCPWGFLRVKVCHQTMFEKVASKILDAEATRSTNSDRWIETVTVKTISDLMTAETHQGCSGCPICRANSEAWSTLVANASGGNRNDKKDINSLQGPTGNFQRWHPNDTEDRFICLFLECGLINSVYSKLHVALCGVRPDGGYTLTFALKTLVLWNEHDNAPIHRTKNILRALNVAIVLCMMAFVFTPCFGRNQYTVHVYFSRIQICPTTMIEHVPLATKWSDCSDDAFNMHAQQALICMGVAFVWCMTYTYILLTQWPNHRATLGKFAASSIHDKWFQPNWLMLRILCSVFSEGAMVRRVVMATVVRFVLIPLWSGVNAIYYEPRFNLMNTATLALISVLTLSGICFAFELHLKRSISGPVGTWDPTAAVHVTSIAAVVYAWINVTRACLWASVYPCVVGLVLLLHMIGASSPVKTPIALPHNKWRSALTTAGLRRLVTSMDMVAIVLVVYVVACAMCDMRQHGPWRGKTCAAKQILQTTNAGVGASQSFMSWMYQYLPSVPDQIVNIFTMMCLFFGLLVCVCFVVFVVSTPVIDLKIVGAVVTGVALILHLLHNPSDMDCDLEDLTAYDVYTPLTFHTQEMQAYGSVFIMCMNVVYLVGFLSNRQ